MGRQANPVMAALNPAAPVALRHWTWAIASSSERSPSPGGPLQKQPHLRAARPGGAAAHLHLLEAHACSLRWGLVALKGLLPERFLRAEVIGRRPEPLGQRAAANGLHMNK